MKPITNDILVKIFGKDYATDDAARIEQDINGNKYVDAYIAAIDVYAQSVDVRNCLSKVSKQHSVDAMYMLKLAIAAMFICIKASPASKLQAEHNPARRLLLHMQIMTNTFKLLHNF